MASLPENERKIMNFFFTGRENAEKTMTQDLLCCVNYAKNLEAVDGERLGITGFCLGGGTNLPTCNRIPIQRGSSLLWRKSQTT